MTRNQVFCPPYGWVKAASNHWMQALPTGYSGNHWDRLKNDDADEVMMTNLDPNTNQIHAAWQTPQCFHGGVSPQDLADPAWRTGRGWRSRLHGSSLCNLPSRSLSVPVLWTLGDCTRKN